MSASRELADLVSESPSTDLNLDNNSLFVDVSENRVGIGTTTPGKLLHLHGASTEGIRIGVSGQSYYHEIRSNGDGLLLSADDSNAGGVGADIRFHVGGSEKIRIKENGRVGIGTTDPSPGYGGSDPTLEIAGATSPSLTINDTGQAEKYTLVADSDDIKIAYGSTVLATFQNDGAVGIGTTAPASIDSWGKVLEIYSATGADLILNHSDASSTQGIGQITFARDNVVLASINGVTGSTTGKGDINFRTNDGTGNATKMMIDENGRVGIGITSPGFHLDLQNGGGDGIRVAGYSTGAGNDARLYLARSNSGTLGTQTAVDNSDAIGKVIFQGSNGSSFVTGASVSALARETWSGTQYGTEMSFKVTKTGETSETEALVIDKNARVLMNAGNVGIGLTAPHYQVHVGGNSKNIGMQQGYMTGTTVTLTDASAFDILFFRKSDGTAIGTGIAGHVYLTAVNSADVTSKVYVLTTTSNGATGASIHEVTNGSEVRGTLTVNTPTIVADGALGGIKLRITRNVAANVVVNTLFVGVHATS